MPASVTNKFVEKGLIYNVDLKDTSSVSPRNDVSFPSLAVKGQPLPNLKLNKAISLPEFGICLSEIEESYSPNYGGWVNEMNGLVLNEVPNRAFTGNSATIVTDENQQRGQYVDLNGTYLQRFFKIEGFDYELLPARYRKGVTIETSLLIREESFSINTENIFLYLGTSSENRFYKDLSGEQAKLTTSEGIPLAPDHEDQPELGVEGNVIAFLFDDQGRIGYKMVADDLIVESQFSTNQITHTGWVNISMSFTPCEIIENEELLACAGRRNGTLRIFVNGIAFHEFINFPEYMFKPMQTETAKQIGVPYTISWGGGSKGLGNQLRFRSNLIEDGTYIQIPGNTYLIMKEFDRSFIGGIQTLRIYDRPLSVLEARANHNYLAPRYGLQLVKGGRTTPAQNW